MSNIPSTVIYDADQVDALLTACADASSLLVLTHGWNNDMAEARQLYNEWLASLRQVDSAGSAILSKTTVLQVFWPSKKFAAEDLIAGGGAASLSEGDEIQLSLQALKHDPYLLGDHGSETVEPVWSNDIDHAMALVDQLENSEQARREFVLHIRAALNPAEAHNDDASREFFELEPDELFERFGDPVAMTDSSPDGGSAGGVGLTAFQDAGGAAFLSGGWSKIKSAAVRIANYATYYQMKSRAGAVGRNGLAQTLELVRQQYPQLPAHLIGHSFGARAVVAAVAQLTPGKAPVSLSLFQAAFSHNGFAEKFDDKHDGAFRSVVKDLRATGPIIITHTKNDRAIGIAYPLASRIARDNAAALGDKNDPYGGMGRNGAQHTPEVNTTEAFLRDWDTAAPYDFSPGHVYNLQADRFIDDHADVKGVEVAYATLHAMRSAISA